MRDTFATLNFGMASPVYIRKFAPQNVPPYGGVMQIRVIQSREIEVIWT
ncbi:hypothetical protein TDB9533_03167 [Thalassocella blandensis]|nr:hypothetical protein TDB9533_03167 [Thalassocella blandensis]